MAQPAAIDPVQRPAPARPNTARSKQNASFAAALGETRDPAKTKIEKRPSAERASLAQNREPTTQSHDAPSSRKTDHERKRAPDTKPNTAQTRDTPKPEEQAPSSPQDAKSDDVTQPESPAVTEETVSTSEDKTADEQTEQAADKPAEIPLPQQNLTPTTAEKSPPPAQPTADAEDHNADGEKVTSEIDAAGSQSAKPANPMQYTAAPKPVDNNGTTKQNDQPSVDKSNIVTEGKSAAREGEAQNTEHEPRVPEATDKPVQRTELQGQQTGPANGTNPTVPSGPTHTFHHHLAPNEASSPLPPTPSAADIVKPTPVPYHTLPIEIGLRALDGTKEITLDLTPKELGQLNIRILVDEQSAIQVSIATERPQTLAMLQHDASHIRHALEQAGYSTQDSSLQFSLQNNLSSDSNSSRDDQRKQSSRHASGPDIESGELETSAPTRQRIYLNQLDLSV